jgi:hypothetical protein
MGRVNIQTFSPSDSQSDLISKLNYNFNELVGSYGGTLADKGPTGERGFIGLRGPVGSTGYQGKRGSRWFAGPSGPTGPDINYGDYWIDLVGDCYKFSTSGWEFVTSLRVDPALFRFVDAGTGPGGATGGSVITMDQANPERYSLVFADDDPGSVNNLNPEGAKFVISTNTDVSGSYLLEFTRGDQDTAGSTGSTSDGVRHPFFSWYGSQSSANLNFGVPGEDFYVDYGGGTGAFRTSLTLDAGNGDIVTGEELDLSGGGGSSIQSADLQNWTAQGNISMIAPNASLIASLGGITLTSSSTASFGFLGSGNSYDFRVYPVVPQGSGYVVIRRNSNSATTFEYSVPFLNKIYLNSSDLDSYNSLSRSLFGVNSTFSSGSPGTLECMLVRENGVIYTEKTSERYYNLTTAEFTLGS